MADAQVPYDRHSHVFLGEGHEHAERRTWIVIALCGAMMVLEIGGGALFGSIALVADGLHMSTHAGALLLAAMAYSYARKHATDRRFSFGTGKLGDLAGFTSAVVLAMIALLIAYEAISRLFDPVAIDFREAIPIACLGLAVNAASAWLLSSGHDHHHGHGHGHAHAQGGHNHAGHDHEGHAHHESEHRIATHEGTMVLSIFETDHPPVFRLRSDTGIMPAAATLSIVVMRPDGASRTFAMMEHDGYLQSVDAVPEPHAFVASVQAGGEEHKVTFAEPAQAAQTSLHRDNNMRAAVVHVIADAAVSVLVIIGLFLARAFGWLWMDPLVGVVGSLVIASWAYGLIRDTGAILLDMVPDRGMQEGVTRIIEAEGDQLLDFHVWRLGPGHLGAIVAVSTATDRDVLYYRRRLSGLPALSHLTIEVQRAA